MQRIVFIFVLAFCATSVQAAMVETLSPAKVYKKKGKKRLKRVATARGGVKYRLIGKTRNGRWMIVRYKGKKAYFKSKDVKVLGIKKKPPQLAAIIPFGGELETKSPQAKPYEESEQASDMKMGLAEEVSDEVAENRENGEEEASEEFAENRENGEEEVSEELAAVREITEEGEEDDLDNLEERTTGLAARVDYVDPEDQDSGVSRFDIDEVDEIEDEPDRRLASLQPVPEYEETNESESTFRAVSEEPKAVFLSLMPAVQSGSYGVGLGAGASLSLKERIFRSPLELAGYGFWYPSVGDVTGLTGGSVSANAYGFHGVARTMVTGKQTHGFGIEAGLTWLHTAVGEGQLNTLAIPGASTSNVLVSIGGMGRVDLSDGFYLDAGTRVQVGSSFLFQLYAGIAFGI